MCFITVDHLIRDAWISGRIGEPPPCITFAQDAQQRVHPHVALAALIDKHAQRLAKAERHTRAPDRRRIVKLITGEAG